jgi:hypothetical protein
MKAFFVWITIILFIYVSLPVSASAAIPISQSDTGTIPDSQAIVFPLGLKVYPKSESIIVKPAANKIGILTTTIPFYNEFGELFDFEVNFGASTWVIKDANNIMARGALDSGQAETIKLYSLDRLKPESQRTFKNLATILVIVGLIIAALSLGFQVMSYLDNLAEAEADARREGNMCAASIARDTANALTAGRAACNNGPRQVEGGKICISTPDYNNARPDMCMGMTFSGACKEICN